MYEERNGGCMATCQDPDDAILSDALEQCYKMKQYLKKKKMKLLDLFIDFPGSCTKSTICHFVSVRTIAILANRKFHLEKMFVCLF